MSDGWTLLIHGGAGRLSRGALTAVQDETARAGLHRALRAGGAILADGGTALDAVEAAVRVLEDDPHFNAARGAVLTFDGGVELDAAIMDGARRAAGAVAGVTATRNPVRLARAVMDRSPHVFLAAAGADAFSRNVGLEQVDAGYFRTADREAALRMLQEEGGEFDAGVKYGTVGAVARDAAGHVAAATSTGGLTGKRWGRIGDTPVIGAGTYADDRGAAVSATGSGEFYLCATAGHEISARMRMLGEAADVAAAAVQQETKQMGGDGGVIVVGGDGSCAWSFNTAGMYRGVLREGSDAVVAIYGDEAVTAG